VSNRGIPTAFVVTTFPTRVEGNAGSMELQTRLPLSRQVAKVPILSSNLQLATLSCPYYYPSTQLCKAVLKKLFLRRQLMRVTHLPVATLSRLERFGRSFRAAYQRYSFVLEFPGCKRIIYSIREEPGRSCFKSGCGINLAVS
jgi:hypothetical protein